MQKRQYNQLGLISGPFREEVRTRTRSLWPLFSRLAIATGVVLATVTLLPSPLAKADDAMPNIYACLGGGSASGCAKLWPNPDGSYGFWAKVYSAPSLNSVRVDVDEDSCTGQEKFQDLGVQNVNNDIFRLDIGQLPVGHLLFLSVFAPDTKASLGCGQFGPGSSLLPQAENRTSDMYGCFGGGSANGCSYPWPNPDGFWAKAFSAPPEVKNETSDMYACLGGGSANGCSHLWPNPDGSYGFWAKVSSASSLQSVQVEINEDSCTGQGKFQDLGVQSVNNDILRFNVGQLPVGHLLFFNVSDPNTKASLGCGQFGHS